LAHLGGLVKNKRDDGTAWQATTGQVTCSPTRINESTRPWTWCPGTNKRCYIEPDSCVHCY